MEISSPFTHSLSVYDSSGQNHPKMTIRNLIVERNISEKLLFNLLFEMKLSPNRVIFCILDELKNDKKKPTLFCRSVLYNISQIRLLGKA